MIQNTEHDQSVMGSLNRLNAVRVIAVICIAIGYASTMPLGPGNPEMFAFLEFDPSWIGIQVLFFISGFLAMRSIARGSSPFEYLRSRFLRNIPLLAACTLIAVLVIYPALGVKTGNMGETLSKLGLYFFETISCVDPGRVLPGLLDEARYMCLIQGAIWTFRWGAIAHIAAALGVKIGVLKNRKLVMLFAAIAVMGYFVVNYIHAKTGLAYLEKPMLALRLSWPFLAGMTYFAYRDNLALTFPAKLFILAAMGAGAIFWHTVLPWTPAIEILLTGFWIYAAMLLALSKTPALKALDNWPNLALGLYLVNWPASQLILLGWPNLTPAELIAVSIPVSILAAYAAHICISKPLYKFADSFSRQDFAPRPPAFSQ